MAIFTCLKSSDKRMKYLLVTTHGIVHAGFRGFREFVTCKKGQCKLIGNRFVIPHDTIP